MFNFKIIAKSTDFRARAGVLRTVHGEIKTPVFMPVGTLGTVKSLAPEELVDCGTQIILGNTYHLYLRPGCKVIERFSGLHRFMNWNGPILTDSGGFQIFSLAKLTKLAEEGVEFQSHIDGSKHLITPEKAIEIQICLGSDIVMCLDQCIKYPANLKDTKDAVELTTRWGERCKNKFEKSANLTANQSLFGIVQGGMFKDLREMSVEAMVKIGFVGFAIGGLSVGEPKEIMRQMADFTLLQLPDLKPKYIMGVGTPEDLVELVALGADMFDCVLPTRNARNGQMFTKYGTINICNSRFKHDTDPIESDCTCYTCKNFSRAYLRHLYMAKEILAYRFNTVHNIHYYTNLMAQMRQAIKNDAFEVFRNDFYKKQNRRSS